MPDMAWRRLGEMLLRKRENLDARYGGRRGLTLFAEARGINRRVAWDIENARRDNFDRSTLRDIESAYGLERWAIEKFLTVNWAEIDAGGLSPAEARFAAEAWQANYVGDGPVYTAAELRGFIARRIREGREATARNGEPQQAAG